MTIDRIKQLAGLKEDLTEGAEKVGHMEMFFADRDGGEKSMEVEVTLSNGKLEVTGGLPGPEDDMYWDDADIEEQLRDAMQDMSVIDWMTNEAGGYYTQPVYDMIEKDGVEKVMRDMLEFLHADVIQDFVNKMSNESVSEAPAKGSYGGMPQEVKLAGDSIWDTGYPNPDMVTVTDIEVAKSDGGYIEVTVEHDGPWTIYTDTGFEKAISDMIDMEVSFSEQGMQEDGRAHLEGGNAMEMESKQWLKSRQFSSLKKNAGVI